MRTDSFGNPNPLLGLSDKSLQKTIDWERNDLANDHSWYVAIQFKDGYEATCDRVSDNGQVDPERLDWFHPLPDCK